MINVECRRAGIGCVDCKKLFARESEQSPGTLPRQTRSKSPHSRTWYQTVLADGARRARVIAEKTMEEVRAAVQLP